MNLYESIKNNLNENAEASKDVLEKIELYINKDISDQIRTSVDSEGHSSGWSANGISTNASGVPFLEIYKNGYAPVDVKYLKKAILKAFPEAQVILVDVNQIFVYIN